MSGVSRTDTYNAVAFGVIVAITTNEHIETSIDHTATLCYDSLSVVVVFRRFKTVSSRSVNIDSTPSPVEHDVS